MGNFWQDVRHALRMLNTSRGFATVAVLTLALGIGANTAIFSVVNGLAFRSLPVAEPHRLFSVSSGTEVTYEWTYAIWDQIRQRQHLFDGALAWASARFNLAQRGETQPVEGLFVSGSFFATLGVPALLGRTLTPAEDSRGGGPAGPVAVISYSLWQRRFGGAASVIGTPLVVDQIPFTIVGVTPPDFFGVEVGRAFDVALPLNAEPLIRGKDSALDRPRAWWLNVMLRLKPEHSLETATAALRGVQPQIRAAATPHEEMSRSGQTLMELDEPFTLVTAATGTSRLRQRYTAPLATVLILVAIVLLIACANVATLFLARATARRHEVSVRIALGASRRRLVQQLFTESAVLAGLGAVLGLLIAFWGGRALVAQLSSSVNQVVLDVSLDWRVLAFTATVAAATAMLFGAAPARGAMGVAPAETLKQPGRGAGAKDRESLFGGIVIAQVALSMVLVIGASLLVATFARLSGRPPGFDAHTVLVVNVDARRADVDPAERLAFYDRLIEAVAAVPGVERAAASEITPVSGSLTAFPVRVSHGAAMSEPKRVLANYVTPRWFATYGTPLRAGRDFNERDTNRSLPVAVVNESFVRTFLSGQPPLNATVIPLSPPGSDDPSIPVTIVGVVSDAIYRSLREDLQPILYRPLSQRESGTPPPQISMSVRASGESPARLVPSVAATLMAFDRDLAFMFRPFGDQVKASLAQERVVAWLAAVFGTLAVLLAGLGLYGITSYGVTRGRTEIGIRMALGARHVRVIWLVLRKSLVLTLVGILLGITAAAAVTRYLGAMLFGIKPIDPLTFTLVSAVFLVVATLAAFLPARRAANVDPLIALRSQ